ncbi:Hemolysin activation/secretion protein [Methylacidiphilum infernorum V4]|uniref:Hemolysin activation/secretion protein n=1 Tax=Methylacidiphilum infernorum (isolate V4) TaxID=481448 RepID=B3DZ38_METI4|nr:Hemolysin activation/secretion protein [Methylacidiphilum infernorum V4]
MGYSSRQEDQQPEVPPVNLPGEKHAVSILNQKELKAKPVIVSTPTYTYIVTGNTLLSQGTIKKALKKAVGPEDALNRLKMLYQQKGYFLVTVRAYTEDKQVELEVIEGRISAIHAEKPLDLFYYGIKNRPDVQTSDVIRDNINAENYARRQQEQPKIHFEPGQDYATSEMFVESQPVQTFTPNVLDEAKPWDTSVMFGNYGTRFVSRYLTDLVVGYRPGYGLQITGDLSEGLTGFDTYSNGGIYYAGTFGLSWANPYGVYGVMYRQMHFQEGPNALGLFNIPGMTPELATLLASGSTGDLRYWQFYGQQVAYASESIRWGFDEYLAFTNFQDFFIFQHLYAQDYNSFQVGSTYTQNFIAFGRPAHWDGGIHAVHSYAHGGFQILNQDVNSLPGAPNPYFTYFKFNADYVQGLPYGMNFMVSGYGQVSENTLPIMDMWILGGMGNLSAWYPAVLFGDTGFIGRSVLYSPTWNLGGFTINASGYTEFGGSRFNFMPKGAVAAWQYLGDVGVSVDIVHRYGTTISAYAAFPVMSINVPVDQRNYATGGRAAILFVLRQNF